MDLPLGKFWTQNLHTQHISGNSKTRNQSGLDVVIFYRTWQKPAKISLQRLNAPSFQVSKNIHRLIPHNTSSLSKSAKQTRKRASMNSNQQKQ